MSAESIPRVSNVYEYMEDDEAQKNMDMCLSILGGLILCISAVAMRF